MTIKELVDYALPSLATYEWTVYSGGKDDHRLGTVFAATLKDAELMADARWPEHCPYIVSGQRVPPGT